MQLAMHTYKTMVHFYIKARSELNLSEIAEHTRQLKFISLKALFYSPFLDQARANLRCHYGPL